MENQQSLIFISPFFPSLGMKIQNLQQKAHEKSLVCIFVLFQNGMDFLEKLKCFVFLVSIVPSKIPNSMRVSKMEGTGVEWSIYSGFTAVGCSTSS